MDEENVPVGRMMVGTCQRKVGGEDLLKEGGHKDGEARKENLASCIQVVQIPAVKYIKCEG